MSEELTNFATGGIALHSLMTNVSHGSNKQNFVSEFQNFINSIFKSFSKGSNFCRIKRRMNIIFSARGDKSISNFLNYIGKKEAH